MMFRNIDYDVPRTKTTFAGNSNVLGSSNQNLTSGINTRTTQLTEKTDIMYAVLTSNLQEVKRLVNSYNSNDIIDTLNNYTALHHAVRIKANDKIIEYLMSVGANPKLKQNENKDAIDLSIESNNKYLIDKLINENKIELDKIKFKYNALNNEYKMSETKNKILEDENKYLKNSQSQNINRIEELKTENVNLKRKYDDSEKAFTNLLKKTKK